jgi:hypothetical protein
MSRCVKCGEALQGLDYLQGFEYRFCQACVKSSYFNAYDDLEFLDETEDEDEEEEEDDDE